MSEEIGDTCENYADRNVADHDVAEYEYLRRSEHERSSRTIARMTVDVSLR